jgi:hypothetical protein
MGLFDEITGLFRDRSTLVAEDKANIAFTLQQALEQSLARECPKCHAAADKDALFCTK